MDAVQQPPRDGELAGEERSLGEVRVAQLGTPQVVGLEDRVDSLVRRRDEQPGEVVRGVGDLRLRPPQDGDG